METEETVNTETHHMANEGAIPIIEGAQHQESAFERMQKEELTLLGKVEKLLQMRKFDRGDIASAIAALRGLHLQVSQVVRMLISDLGLLLEAQQARDASQIQLQTTVTVLVEALIEKGLIVQEDIQRVWEEKVKPRIRAAQQAAVDAAKQQLKQSEQPAPEQPNNIEQVSEPLQPESEQSSTETPSEVLEEHLDKCF